MLFKKKANKGVFILSTIIKKGKRNNIISIRKTLKLKELTIIIFIT